MADRLITDIGGLPAGEIPRDERPPVFWEQQMIATFNLIREEKRRLTNLDELRRAVEQMSPAEYGKYSFYGRRLEATINLLVEKNVIDRSELDRRTDEILKKGTRAHGC